MITEKRIPLRSEQNSVCFTGHRSLSHAEIPCIRDRLQRIIGECYRSGYRWFICGGALGFDTLAALEVISAKDRYPDIGLCLALPCADQCSRWKKPDRDTYERICHQADETVILSTHYYTGCMHLRNRYMVQHSSVCVCWMRRFSGGTGYTVRYAVACQRRIINLCIPESNAAIHIKEPSWNCTFTFPSVSGNAITARSIPTHAFSLKKWSNMCLRSSGKRRSVQHLSMNR